MKMSSSKNISKTEIRDILVKRYNKTHRGHGLDRKLIVLSPDKNSDSDCYFFSLEGTPPKGYGIFIPEGSLLWLYDATGKRFKEYYLEDGISDLQNI